MGNAVGIKEGAQSIRGVALLLVAMGLALLLTNGVAHAAAPTNNNFANAQQITGAQATLVGTNVDATKESGEPNHAGNAGGKSVWYSWQAPSSDPVTISTTGSNFDTLLAVYTGNAVNGLAPVTSNDDADGRQQSSVDLQVTAGTTYRIAVDGFNGSMGAASGSITLNLAPASPENDNFANAEQITGTNATLTGTNAGATKESGEPSHAGNDGGKSVWYRWQAPSSGEMTIDTSGSNFDTLLAVYTGNAVNGLTELASNDEDPSSLASTSKVESVPVVAGTTYRIAVDGYNDRVRTFSGSITLNLATYTPPPENDNFANAEQITGAEATLTGTNAEATKESGEPNHAGNAGGKSVWYSWQAPSSGPVTISTTGSSFDTLLAVYTGNAVGSLTEVASNDEDTANRLSTSRLESVQVTAGTTYRIAVDGYKDLGDAASGSITLNVAPDIGPPENDNFANAEQITGAEATLTGTNAEATKESGEPNHAGNDGGRSVWYRWTPQSSGTATISTIGSNFDTLLAVYTGNAIGSLTQVASNDDEDIQNNVSTSKVGPFWVTAGTTYRIAVDGFNNNGADAKSGSITLNSQLSPDTTAPAAPVITAPADGSYDKDGSFTVSGTAEPNTTVRLLDGGEGLPNPSAVSDAGNWSIELTGVSEGLHSYTAKASDGAGNVSPESAARTVKVDMTAPTVEDWTPTGKKVRPTAKPTVTFSEAMDKGSVEAADANGLPTAIVLKKGSVQVAATVVLDASGERATLRPARALKRGATYTVTVTGAATDAAGNALDQDPRLSGEQPKSWKFTIKR